MRSIFLILALALVHSGVVSGKPPPVAPITAPQVIQTDESRKNVLLIAVDDLRPELGCYGADYAQSPHLDALAKQSLIFKNHFVQVPTCGASRYALLTGRSPLFSKAMGNGAMYSGKTALLQKQLPGAQSLPELFRRSGYRTVCIGKISHTADGRVFDYLGRGDGRMEIPNGWDELATPFGLWQRGWGIFFAYANGKSREGQAQDNHETEDSLRQRDLMQFEVVHDDDLPDGLMATKAIEKLKQLKESRQPFFMGLGFFKPHLPFVAPRRDWEAFQNTDIPIPPHNVESASLYSNRTSGEFFGYHFPYDKKRPLDDAKILVNRRAYLACVRYTDRQIGRVLTSLEELGLRESTIVVLWSDHGWNLGDSRQWGKHTALERAVRSPLMISVPGMKTAGQETNALVESIDLFPTLIELCQPSFRKTEHPLDGKSLVPLLNHPDGSIRDVSFSYWQNTVSIRNENYRMIGTKTKTKTKAKTKETKSKESKVPPPLELARIELYSANQQYDPVKNLAAENPDIVENLIGEFRKFQKRETHSESSTRQNLPD